MTPAGRVLAVSVGRPRDVAWTGGTARTAIWKAPVDGRRRLERLGVEGDAQADLVGHGGEHRAALVYQIDSHHHWEQELGHEPLGPGGFGENLTVTGLGDGEVCIGDRYRVGGALVEVTQPRVTCFKLGLRLAEPRMAALLVAADRPGFYLRVLEEGDVGAGDAVELVAADPRRMTVAAASALLYRPGRRREDLERALQVPALPPGWRSSFADLLAEEDGTAPPPARRPAAWSGFRPFVVRARRQESRDVASFELAPEDGAALPPHLPGQFVTLSLPQPGEDRGPVRNYSLSRAAGGETLRISVKREDAGLASRRMHDDATPGHRILVAAPRGTFTLDVAATGPVVLFSAGVGITPVLAMLDALARAGSDRDVWWLHTARNGAEHPFRDEVHALLQQLPRAHRHVRYTRPLPGDRGGAAHDATGRIEVADLAALGVPRDADYYLCGPSSFLADVPPALRAWGVDPEHVHLEAFGAPPARGDRPAPHPPASGPGTGPPVTFARSGLTVAWDREHGSLLELAEACDVPVDWSCRTGVCHRCESGVLDGRFTHDPQPLDPPGPGRVLLCCARPVDELVLDL